MSRFNPQAAGIPPTFRQYQQENKGKAEEIDYSYDQPTYQSAAVPPPGPQCVVCGAGEVHPDGSYFYRCNRCNAFHGKGGIMARASTTARKCPACNAVNLIIMRGGPNSKNPGKDRWYCPACCDVSAGEKTPWLGWAENLPLRPNMQQQQQPQQPQQQQQFGGRNKVPYEMANAAAHVGSDLGNISIALSSSMAQIQGLRGEIATVQQMIQNLTDMIQGKLNAENPEATAYMTDD